MYKFSVAFPDIEPYGLEQENIWTLTIVGASDQMETIGGLNAIWL